MNAPEKNKYNWFLNSILIYQVTNMLAINCYLTITNFDAAAHTFRWNDFFLLQVFLLRSFINIAQSGWWSSLWYPAQICLRFGAAPSHRESGLVTCSERIRNLISGEVRALMIMMKYTWESHHWIHRWFPLLVLFVISWISGWGGGDLVEIVQRGEDTALASLGETWQEQVGVHFWFVQCWRSVSFL